MEKRGREHLAPRRTARITKGREREMRNESAHLPVREAARERWEQRRGSRIRYGIARLSFPQTGTFP